jgi:hypothetical protein
MGQQILNLSGQSRILLDEDLLASSFDRTSRYFIVSQIIKNLIKEKNKKVLDVGGLGSILPRLVKQKVNILDVDENDDPNYIQGNAMNSDVQDGSFDAVVTCDTLEHIPSKERMRFIQELIRISKDYVIICAPFDQSGVAEAEDDMNRLYGRLSGRDHRWLKEHIEIGIPSVSETEKVLRNAKVNYVKFGHTDVQSWRCLIELNFLAECIESDSLRRHVAEINKMYNASLIYRDFSNTPYRLFYVISKNNAIKFDEVLPGDAKQILLEKVHEVYADITCQTGLELMKKREITAKYEELERYKDSLKKELDNIHASKTWRLLKRIMPSS